MGDELPVRLTQRRSCSMITVTGSRFSQACLGCRLRTTILIKGAGTMHEAKIIDRGRGPEIAGSRITVFDVLDYLQEGWNPVEIALFFRLSTRQVDVAGRYIEERHDDVMEEYRGILERCGRGNPPALQ